MEIGFVGIIETMERPAVGRSGSPGQAGDVQDELADVDGGGLRVGRYFDQLQIAQQVQRRYLAVRRDVTIAGDGEHGDFVFPQAAELLSRQQQIAREWGGAGKEVSGDDHQPGAGVDGVTDDLDKTDLEPAVTVLRLGGSSSGRNPTQSEVRAQDRPELGFFL